MSFSDNFSREKLSDAREKYLESHSLCPICKGYGFVPNFDPDSKSDTLTCSSCNGKGLIEIE